MAVRPALRPRARLRSGAAPLAALTLLLGGLAGVASGAGPAGAAPVHPGGRPGVSAVHAVSASSTAVRLTWHNPHAGGRVATVVRYAAGSHAPTSPTAGRAAGRPGSARSALTVDRLHPATRYSFALFTAYGHGRFGARVVVRATTAPDAVRLVQPFERGSTVTITWLAPGRDTYAATVVRYTAGGRAPAGPHEGTAVALRDAHATSARITGLPAAATYAVAIWTRDRAGRYSSVATTRFTTPAGADTATGDITGTVTDDAAHPLAGADVLVVDGDSAATWSTTTDTSGHYTVTVPARGVTVVLAGDHATGGDGDAAGYQSVFESVVVPARGTKTVNGALDPGGEIDGQVTDVHGNPLAGVSISSRSPDAYVTTDQSFFFISYSGSGLPVTDADGRFQLRGAPPLAEQVCYDPASAPVTGGTNDAGGYRARCEHRAVAAGPGATRTLAPAALLPAATGTVTGVVTDAAGHPVEGVIVDVSAHDVDAEGAGAAMTDATGHYRVGALRPGRYDVCADPSAVQLPSGSVGNALTCRFAVARVSRARVTVIDVSLRAAGALSGRVRGPAGRGVPALVIVQSQGGSLAAFAFTDDRGQYVVPNLAPGRYRVCFDGFADSPGGVQPGCYREGDLAPVRRGVTRLGVDVRLAAGGAVRGRVTGHLGGDEVFVAALAPGADEPAGETLADPSGNYEISGLPAGRYLLCAVAFAAGGENDACRRGAVSVRIGRVTAGVDIALPAGGTVTATVTNEDGRPVPGVDVTVVAPCPESEGCAGLPLFSAGAPPAVAGSDMTDADGRVRLAVPPSSHYAVCAFTYYGAAISGDPATGYRDACTTYGTFGVTVHKAQDTAVAFTLHPAGAVAGRVTDGAGHPLAGVRVAVSGSSSTDYYDPEDTEVVGSGFDFTPPGPASDATTDADGTYVVPGVAPGQRTVCFDPQGAVDVTGAAHPNGILAQCVGTAPGTGQGGTPVAVPAAGTVSGVDQQLVDAAVVTGRIVDRSTGRPVRQPVAFAFAGKHDVAASGTDSHGRYRLTGLAPGKVRVCFAAFHYRPQCYDGVAWSGRTLPTQGTLVTTTAGATITLKDARLRRE